MTLCSTRRGGQWPARRCACAHPWRRGSRARRPRLIYSDPGLTQALANPIGTDGLGNYTFYAAPGRYEIEISGPGITTKQIPNVILPSDPTAPTFTTVSTTSGISAFSLSLAGNLTVSGSAAVTGAFTVGGAPVASTGVDNKWTGSQRFKGPIPYRDVTAYMPLGGCDNTASSLNNVTATINSGSAAATLSADNDFKNGCGIFIAGAGATSTLSAPAQGTAPNPVVVGATGSTTVHYKVVAIDQITVVRGELGHHGHDGSVHAHADELCGFVLAGSRGRGRLSDLQRSGRRSMRRSDILSIALDF